MQYSKRRVSWFIEPLCPASGFVTADNYDSRIPPHAILPHVVGNPKRQNLIQMINLTKEITIKTTLTKDETIERIMSNIDNVRKLKFQNIRFSFRKYEGYFSDDNFTFRRILKRYRYSAIPIATGHIYRNNDSTTINLTVKPKKHIMIFMLFFNLFFTAILTIGLISFGNQLLVEKSPTIIIILQLSLILVGNFLYRLSFQIETYILEKDFRKLLQGNISELKLNGIFDKFYDLYSD